MEKKTLVGLMAVVLVATAQAYTVYDAGKALRQNATSGSITGANGETYTDENGGKWQYLRANDNMAATTVAFGKSVTSGIYRGIGGNSSGAGAPYLQVNTKESEIPVTNGEPIEPDELYVHPGDPNSANSYVVLRFTVPEDGWYSALLSAHDANKQANGDNASGAEIRMLANGKLQARGVVSLEDYTNSTVRALLTHRFDFQMPVRWMAANETLDFMVGANGGHNSDATGLKVFVTKEDAGMFYDSGIAMTNNLATVYTNVYGTVKDGTWYYLLPWVNVSTGAAFETWAPLNFSKRITAFTNRCTRTASSNQRGFACVPEGKAPYMIVNETDTMASVAPQELHIHPANIQQPDSSWRPYWATVRFRAPVSGYYSASVVARDVSSSLEDPNSNGVRVYLNVSDHVVDSAHVSGEFLSSTAHLSFGPRLLVAGEPVDVIISPVGNYSSDATGISIILRREEDVYDAGKSFYAHHAAGNHTHPFPDALGGGATWDLGCKTNASCGTQFWSLPAYKTLNGTDLSWWVHSASGTQENGTLPRIVMATNGIASGDSFYVGRGILCTTPYEFFVHPNSVNVQSSSPTLRAAVPADGIYHARCYARDLSQYDLNGGGDGIRLGISASGFVPDQVVVSRDLLNRNNERYESAASADRLWLKAGENLEFVVDPNDIYNGDSTGLTACYAKEGDVEADTRVVNVHFTESGTGKFSATGQRPREGWADWNKWNALRAGDAASASVRNCYEADGMTQRNLAVTLTHDSGAAIAKGTGNAVFFSHVASSGADDTYTFTVGNLKTNELYTLYLYSVKSFTTNTPGNATFTVGGVTKGVENTLIGNVGQKVVTRFDVTSDANGQITGTFAAADANGGAFNGLTLVGALPAYVPTGTLLIVK